MPQIITKTPFFIANISCELSSLTGSSILRRQTQSLRHEATFTNSPTIDTDRTIQAARQRLTGHDRALAVDGADRVDDTPIPVCEARQDSHEKPTSASQSIEKLASRSSPVPEEVHKLVRNDREVVQDSEDQCEERTSVTDNESAPASDSADEDEDGDEDEGEGYHLDGHLETCSVGRCILPSCRLNVERSILPSCKLNEHEVRVLWSDR